MPSIKLPARLENLRKLVRFVSDFAAEQGFQRKRVLEIELATEEALVNIFHYAYPNEKSGDVEIRCNQAENGAITVEIVDSGVPFDIRSAAEPDVTASILDRKVGGLGIFLIQRMVDSVRYRRDGDQNVLTFLIQKRS